MSTHVPRFLSFSGVFRIIILYLPNWLRAAQGLTDNVKPIWFYAKVKKSRPRSYYTVMESLPDPYNLHWK